SDVIQYCSNTREMAGGVSRTVSDVIQYCSNTREMAGGVSRTVSDVIQYCSNTREMTGGVSRTVSDVIQYCNNTREMAGGVSRTVSDVIQYCSNTREMAGGVSRAVSDVIQYCNNTREMAGRVSRAVSDVIQYCSNTREMAGGVSRAVSDVIQYCSNTREMAGGVSRTVSDVIQYCSNTREMAGGVSRAVSDVIQYCSNTREMTGGVSRAVSDVIQYCSNAREMAGGEKWNGVGGKRGGIFQRILTALSPASPWPSDEVPLRLPQSFPAPLHRGPLTRSPCGSPSPSQPHFTGALRRGPPAAPPVLPSPTSPGPSDEVPLRLPQSFPLHHRTATEMIGEAEVLEVQPETPLKLSNIFPRMTGMTSPIKAWSLADSSCRRCRQRYSNAACRRLQRPAIAAIGQELAHMQRSGQTQLPAWTNHTGWQTGTALHQHSESSRREIANPVPLKEDELLYIRRGHEALTKALDIVEDKDGWETELSEEGLQTGTVLEATPEEIHHILWKVEEMHQWNPSIKNIK
ncbi:unnamed protein product, partial [Coregonus sp. 'balchen']